LLTCLLGETENAFEMYDLEEDWDPDQHEKLLKKIFDGYENDDDLGFYILFC